MPFNPANRLSKDYQIWLRDNAKQFKARSRSQRSAPGSIFGSHLRSASNADTRTRIYEVWYKIVDGLTVLAIVAAAV